MHRLWYTSFIHSIVCPTTGPQSLPKLVLHRVRFSASSFSFQYPVFSVRSFSSWLRLLPRLPVTSILCCIFPSITCFRRQFLRQLWPIQLASLLLTFVGYSVLFNCFYYFISHTIGPNNLLHPSPATHFRTF